MSAPHGPIGARRRLGAELRRLRLHARLNLDDVAKRMRCSTSKISRLETGKGGVPKLPDVRELMRIYGVTSETEQDMLLRLVDEGRIHGWWEQYTGGVHAERFVLGTPGRFAAVENDATGERSFDPVVVPGLLQTESYARTVLAAALPDHSADEIERLVELRLKRQDAVRRPRAAALRFVTVLDEAVLHRSVGGPAVMAEQWRNILEMSRLPNVTVHVLPFTAGVLRAHSGHFALLEIPAGLGSDVVFIESHAGETYLDGESEVEVYKRVFDDVLRRSLPVRDSLAKVGRLLD